MDDSFVSSGNNLVSNTTEPRSVNISPESLNSQNSLRSMDNNFEDNSEREALIHGRKKYTETPLPKMPLLVLAVIVFSEPLNFSFLLPFVYFMVRDFHVVDDEKQIGRYAGLIASSFYLAQFCFAIFWGYMSDKYGRRPILLFGLFGITTSCLLFGFSKNLVWAIITRSLCGMLNGNAGVAKSMLGELTDKTNQAKGFSVFGFCWGLGVIFGPMIGGYLSNPVDKYPKIFGNCAFLKEYPYFLPCFVASLISFTGLIIGFFMLPETRKFKVKDDDESRTLLTSPEPNPIKKSYGTVGDHDNTLTENECVFEDVNYGPTDMTNNVSCTTKKFDRNQELIPYIGITPITLNVVISNAILALHSIMNDEVYTLFAVAKVHDGGLEYQAIDIAQSLTIMGMIHLSTQIYVYPWLARKISIIRLFHLGLLTYVPVYFAFPLINRLKSALTTPYSETIVWYSLLFLLAARFMCNVMAYTSVMILLNNSATNEVLGVANGIGQMTCSFVRAIGPALGGFLWSWSLANNSSFPFNNWFVFIVSSILSFVGWLQSYYLPKELGGF
ncbi:18279_t:CDS:2 [Funneliformis geosporum]|uniref:18279_t:CDS:1 n=1 Tax=Funneliformis geosporum TaxID=1117311 RepID=A0A9W4T031_9GLOM|nr:18279_t:CDS:2 [Funneliformis geosporum]